MTAYAEVDARPAVLTLDRIGDGIERTPKTFQPVVQRLFAQARTYILVDAHTAPYQSPLPFIWSFNPTKQAKARAWWFANYVNNASRKKGSRNRYRRTAELDSATRVPGVITAQGGQLTLENERKGAVYVFGFKQVPSHAASGHPLFSKVAEKWRPLLADGVCKAWLTQADQVITDKP